SAWWVSRERFGRIDEDGYLSTPLIAATTSACATELVASGSNPAEAPEDLVIGPMTAEAFAHSRGGHTDEWMGTEEAFAILAEIYPHLEAMRDDESINEARINALLDLPTVMAVDALLTKKWSRDALEMILSFDHPDFPPARLARLDGDGLCALAPRLGRRGHGTSSSRSRSSRSTFRWGILRSVPPPMLSSPGTNGPWAERRWRRTMRRPRSNSIPTTVWPSSSPTPWSTASCPDG